jgi:hypothetical protein
VVEDLAAVVRRFLQQTSGPTSPSQFVKVYKNWIVEKALPFWSSAGFDARPARFRERLDWLGQPGELPA